MSPEIRPLTEDEVNSIIDQLRIRRPQFTSDKERLLRAIESMGLSTEDVQKLAKKSKGG